VSCAILPLAVKPSSMRSQVIAAFSLRGCRERHEL
jgi:hypothetical protein